MKKKIILFSSIGGALLIGAIILIICLCLPKGEKAYRNIKVFSTSGVVNVIRKSDTISASKNMKLKNEDTVEVKESSSIILKLDEDKFVLAKENTTLKLIASGKENNTKTKILVEKGGVIVEVKEKLKDNESFEIASSNSVMAIRGTRVEFNVKLENDKITTTLSLLQGKTDLYFYKDNKLSKTVFNEELNKVSYTTGLDTDINNISNLIDDKSKIEEINDSDLINVFKVVKEELTSEEIDNIVDGVNNFERDDDNKLNGTIKFLNNVSELEYSLNPYDVFTTDKEYNELVYLYSNSIDGEYITFEVGTNLEVGSTWYFKAISGDAYRSNPFMVTIKKLNLELNINLGQSIYEASMYKANINVSIEDDDFFNSDEAKLLDEYNQPINYIVCKVVDKDGYNHFEELNFRNKSITFNKDYFTRGENYPDPIYMHNNYEIEFEYHLDNTKFEVSNEKVMNYSFTKELAIDNLIVFYNANDELYYMQMNAGSVCPENLSLVTGANEFDEMCYLLTNPDDDPDASSRHDLVTFGNQVLIDSLTGEYDPLDGASDGKLKFWVIALSTVASGDPYGIYLSSDEYNIDIDNIDRTKPVPTINVMESDSLVTYNSDGTVNLYVDLQKGISDGDTILGDYIVRYNVLDSEEPDIFYRGSGRFLALENIAPKDYVIKQVIALDKEVDGIIYGINSFNEEINISAGVSQINVYNQNDGGVVTNYFSFGFSDSASGNITIIDSLGNSHTYAAQDANSDTFDSSINSAIVYANCDKRYNEEFIVNILGENIVDFNGHLTSEQFSLLKSKVKEKYNTDIKGSNLGILCYKVYFQTGEN